MTDQNQNPSDRNDPNRQGAAPAWGSTPGEAGNASGGQYPTGQPGEYAGRDAATSGGQFGQPGEYAGAPTADDHVGRPAPSYGPPAPLYGAPGGDVTPDQNATGQYPGAPFGGQYTAPQQDTGQFGGSEHSPFGHAAFTEQSRGPRQSTDENGERYGVGPFSLREAVIAGLGLLLLIASFLPLVGGDYAEFVGYTNLWGPTPWLVIPGALLFIAAAALLVLRRVVPKLRWRVGSLSVDQFASAAAIVTAGFHLGAILLISSLGAWFGGLEDRFAPGAGPIVGLLVSLVAIALTTLATFIPPFAADFRDRPEAPAHRYARSAKPVPQRPKPAPAPEQQWTPDSSAEPAPTGYADPNAGWNTATAAPAEQWPGSVASAAEPDHGDVAAPVDAAPATAAYAYRPDEQVAPTASSSVDTSSLEEDIRTDDPFAAREPIVAFSDEPSANTTHDESTANTTHVEQVAESLSSERGEPTVAETAPPAVPQPEPFAPYWVLAPEQRQVVDLHSGTPLFEVGPTAWSLAVGERDGGLVIRADDGRVGLLRAVDGLTRG
ncbi:hypothetical protein ELQ90_06960 [Labedella phragmitis]|uniref:Uncharacterized protein n=1 Tax=Labedella phragmitis TaxID=2498849 RepID=A0A3S3ZR77_9MICO|nr:hypothetical protein [Labedella phragmitis]RWZ51827.1 hypothetical protein ELQ90_06960 [Labedella phragmitis]